MANAPNWNDEDAVADWVLDALYGHGYTKTAAHKGDPAPVPRVLVMEAESPQVTEAEVQKYYSSVINDAVTNAEHGNFRPLAHLLHPDHPWNKDQAGGWITVRAALAPRAWQLIYERLTGKHKAKRGRPPKAEAMRHIDPVYHAAIAFDYIEFVLQRAYPEQGAVQIRDRALYAAARSKGIKEETLANYLKRSKTDRRRLPLPHIKISP